ncbi:hypothetical protein [Nocardioides zeicaulis]|uniref:MarR family transcriptional regulator n=1 Tax=Nocardioides zeicaulis TaxID=1776857 RepID=A0ABV6E1I5_9ACTN
MDSNDGHSKSQPVQGDDVDVAALQAELAEAKRIGRWLYDHSPGLRRFLGDVSEWPWLLDADAPGGVDAAHVDDAVRDRQVLHAFAVIQASGRDPFDAQDLPTALGFTSSEFDSTVSRLIHGGLVTGGRYFSRAFVETVTDAGMEAARTKDTAHVARP